jgi:hypothetical protein
MICFKKNRALAHDMQKMINTYFKLDEDLFTPSKQFYFTQIASNKNYIPETRFDDQFEFTANIHLSSNNVDLIGGNFVFNTSNSLQVFEQKSGSIHSFSNYDVF